MTKIKVGGVPEHFNLPWHRCIENNKFGEAGVDLEWKEVPEGTGAMCNLLREEEIDVAVILTEGISRDIINGNQSKIIQNYIGSPLIWGIHVDGRSSLQNINDLRNCCKYVEASSFISPNRSITELIFSTRLRSYSR